MASFEKQYLIRTDPQKFFEALTDVATVQIWSGAPAIMDAKKGTEFSLWSDSIVGINKEVTDNKLVQLWKEQSWPAYSEVRFLWQKVEEGTLVTLTQHNIPSESFEDIARGWDHHYMNPLTTWLESNNL